jgi:DNA-binding NarL/FixJ family response regulator
VLGPTVEGCSNKQIARTLVISRRTLAAHVKHIPATLTAPTRTHGA